jgi:three-Cys-motif partner protein
MSPKDEAARLFDPERDMLSVAELEADAAAALDGLPQPDLDSARMWISKDDGLLVRGVKAHSARKSAMVTANLDTVTTAMGGKWFAAEHGLQFLELYSGPGRLLDETLAKELPGSPLRALDDLRRPFDKYVFNDYSDECVDALKKRVSSHSLDVEVHQGSAFDLVHLETLASRLNPRALIIAYLDPARPQDLRWDALEFLARRFGFIDLIINVPVNSLVRGILGAHAAGHRGPGAAGAFINHPRPWELLQRTVTGKLIMKGSMDAVRAHFDEQLMQLGFKTPGRRTVDFPAGNPYYDMLLVSRAEKAVELWNRTNPPPVEAQTSLLDLLRDKPT